MKIFKYSAIAAIVIAIIGIVACNKNNSEPSDVQTSTKDIPCDYPGYFYCYYYHVKGTDSCANQRCPDPEQSELNLCYINMTCLQEYDDPVIPIGPSKGVYSNVFFCLRNYSQGSECLEQEFDTYFAQGTISFSCDCPAGTPELMEYLPEGYLPAGTYPIYKHGNDAWIDITSAVQQ